MRLKDRWRSVRRQAITWGFVPTVLILAAVAVIAYLAFERASQKEALGHHREQAYLSASRLNEELGKFADELEQVARAQAINEGDSLQKAQTLRKASLRLTAFDGGVVLLDQRGRVVTAEPQRPEIVGQDWSGRIYFRHLLTGEEIIFSNIAYDGPGGASIIAVAVPITGPEGATLGAVIGMFRLGEPTISALYASLIRLRASQSNRVYLVDGYGQIIYHPEVQLIGTSAAGSQAVKDVLTGQLGAWRERGGNGRDVVVSFAPVPGTPWGLISENDWADVIRPGQSYGQFLLFLLALGTVLPAIGFALLAHERRGEALERARLEQEMRLARTIQQTLLPKQMPHLRGWQVHAHYQPAQAVGGDFYDFLTLEDGRLGLVIGDVSGKGMPAALVMATTRSLVRSMAQRLRSPGLVLQQVNDLLDQEIPPKMFVTCLYAVLDPATGKIRMANAGHNLPYRSYPDDGTVGELRATGMPLGLMPGMMYEEIEAVIAPGECLLFHSDGLVEAHNGRRQMFGNPRLKGLLSGCAGNCQSLIAYLLAELSAFAGKGWQQEDDVTLVTLQRAAQEVPAEEGLPVLGLPAAVPVETGWQVLSRFSLPSVPGTDREAMQRVVGVLEKRIPGLTKQQLERLRTAVGEATMNAVEHGNHFDADLPVDISLLASADAVAVQITDHGGGPAVHNPQTPDLQAKLAGRQSPRGWGMFLIRHMVDDVHTLQDGTRHTLELIVNLNGGPHHEQPA